MKQKEKSHTNHLFAVLGCLTGTILAGSSLYMTHGKITLFFVLLSFTGGGLVGMIVGSYLDYFIPQMKNKLKKL